ncbi:MAG: hypothetical protein A3G83_12850 [Betaproteobacteria bacterium RIFCSPLOWO2_12_FULL_68_20]|nr:MAG: hypothetical protein A3G83_12850 [Betaproteobacteria bacterium RIFCSPLOWO2_12_FULL_68_20]
MKILRYAVYSAGALALLLVAAIVAVLVIVDGNFVKSRLEREMKAEHNRVLRIEGEPRLTLFPVASLAIGRSSLTEPGSDRMFVALESAEVAVRVMPLLSGELAVETFRVAGLRANLVRAKDGRMNFDDLLKRGERPKAEAPAGRAEVPRLRIAGLGIERAALNYRDEASGREVNVADLNLKTGRIEADAPSEISVSARVTGRKPELDVALEGKGAARIDLAKQVFAVSGLSLQAKGRVDRDTLAASLSAPEVSVTPEKASGSAVSATLQLKGPQRNVEARLKIAAVEGTASALSVPGLALDVTAAAGGDALKAQLSTPLKANLAAQTWEAPKIAASVTLTSPSIPQKTLALTIAGSLRADLDKPSLAAELATRLDESTIQAKLGASRFAPLVATFEVSIDRLNADRYLPQRKEAKSDERIDLSGLKGITAKGRLQAGSLVVKRVKLENVRAEVKLADGKLEVDPHSASLYGGTLAGSLSADANGNRFALKETGKNVQIGALLRDAAQKDVLEGRGNVTLDLTAAGASVPALKRSLAGKARVEMAEGAVKGVNLAEAYRDVRSALRAGSVQKADMSKKTDFSEASASFAIKQGVARNDDLTAKSPFIRLGGAGDIDIGASTINYLAKASLVATSKGQGGQDLSRLANVTVPVKLTGPLEKPNVEVDYGALAAAAGIGAVQEKIGGTIKEKIGERLKGLFGR